MEIFLACRAAKSIGTKFFQLCQKIFQIEIFSHKEMIVLHKRKREKCL